MVNISLAWDIIYMTDIIISFVDFTPRDLAGLFASSDIQQSTLEIVIDKLILQALEGNLVFVEDVNKALKKLGISFDPVAILKKFKIIHVNENANIYLHPIISPELNLWPHFLEILRNRFGILVSKRMHNLGRYLKYMDTLSAQLQFLVLNLNIEFAERTMLLHLQIWFGNHAS